MATIEEKGFAFQAIEYFLSKRQNKWERAREIIKETVGGELQISKDRISYFNSLALTFL